MDINDLLHEWNIANFSGPNAPNPYRVAPDGLPGGAQGPSTNEALMPSGRYLGDNTPSTPVEPMGAQPGEVRGTGRPGWNW